jgi:hypothetical protein
MWEGLTKKWGQKNKKNSLRVPTKALGEEVLPRVPEKGRSGKRSPSPSARAWHSGKTFSNFLRTAPSNVAIKCTFSFECACLPECCTRGRWPSSSAWLPRVSCAFRHSGKPPFPECNTQGGHSGNSVALRKFSFSCSDDSTGCPVPRGGIDE